MEREFVSFDWDDGNSAKCLKHGLAREEIEAAFRTNPVIAPDPAHSQTEQRFIAIGRNKAGRPMFIAFTRRMKGGQTVIRPISARYMHEKERKRYEARTQNDY
jgi:hypothetical protein